MVCPTMYDDFPGGAVAKNPPAMQEMQKTGVQSLGQEDPLEAGMATHSSILAGKNPMDRGAWRAMVRGVAESDRTAGTENVHSTMYYIIYDIPYSATIPDFEYRTNDFYQN